MKRYLLVEGDFVYPPNHGGRVDAWNRILTISEMGEYIHLICTVKEKPRQEYIDIVNKYVDELTLLPRQNKLCDMLYTRPLQMASRKKLRNLKLNKKYDYMILNGSYIYDIIHNPTLDVKHKILRMNNDEGVYFKGLGRATKSLYKKIYYYWESKKFKNFDKKLVHDIPNIMFVSHDELANYEKKYPWINSCFLPTAVSLDFKRRAFNTNNVLMIGSLFMANNQEGIRYYIQKVHPLLIDVPNYKLVIVGNSRGESIEWLEKLVRNHDNIEVYDSPDDLEPFYDNAAVFVNSMLNGAGVKLKTINAIIQGLPVITTPVGNEGTGLVPGRDIIVSDKAEIMADNICKLFQNRNFANMIVEQGQKYVREHYNQKNVLLEYLAKLDERECLEN